MTERAPGQPMIFLLGTSHRSAPVELRERLYALEDELTLILPTIRDRFGLHEVAALSTCNRFELYGVVEGRHELAHHLTEAYLELHKARSTSAGLPEDEVRRALYLHLDEDAARHVYRVASSLDSLVLGETQITGQFKDAMALAQRVKTMGPMLSRLTQDALATAKKVRTQTAIGKKNVSISHAAIELAQRVFGELGKHAFLIVGAGEMANVAAKYIMSYKPKALYVANRTVEKARELVREVGFGEATSIDELPELLTRADIVLSSTASPTEVISADMVRRAKASRRGRPMILLDIAMPRDIDPECGKLEDVYLFDIDDLKQVVGQNYEERRKAAEEAEVLIERGLVDFAAWRRTLAVKPALAGFRGYLDQLIEKEAQKTLGKDAFKELTPKQREALAALFAAVSARISGDASQRVLNPPEGYFQEQLADALQALFPGKRDPE